jgi:hypothetical protein
MKKLSPQRMRRSSISRAAVVREHRTNPLRCYCFRMIISRTASRTSIEPFRKAWSAGRHYRKMVLDAAETVKPVKFPKKKALIACAKVLQSIMVARAGVSEIGQWSK